MAIRKARCSAARPSQVARSHLHGLHAECGIRAHTINGGEVHRDTALAEAVVFALAVGVAQIVVRNAAGSKRRRDRFPSLAAVGSGCARITRGRAGGRSTCAASCRRSSALPRLGKPTARAASRSHSAAGATVGGGPARATRLARRSAFGAGAAVLAAAAATGRAGSRIRRRGIQGLQQRAGRGRDQQCQAAPNEDLHSAPRSVRPPPSGAKAGSNCNFALALGGLSEEPLVAAK